MDHLDSIRVTYVSGINNGRETEILLFRTYVPGSNPHNDNKYFFINLVIMFWTLNSIYMQFECQYSKSSNVSVEHVQLSRGMYCLKIEILRS